MIDVEVTRLRKLRDTALQARAFAAAAELQPHGRSSIFARSAQCCWRIARLATGTLRAHPYPPFQRDVGALRSLQIGVAARIQGGAARHRSLSARDLDAHLRRVARQLADARALTWDQNLGDAFGRLQAQLGRLAAEVFAAARYEAELQGRAVPAASARPTASIRIEHNREDNWPYLAI